MLLGAPSVLFDGDSRVAGGGGVTAGMEWPSQLINGATSAIAQPLTPLVVWRNQAISGIPITQIPNSIRGAFLYVFDAGHNDLNAGDSSATVYANFLAAVARARSFGSHSIVCCTVYASSLLVGAKNTHRLAYNALVRVAPGRIPGVVACIDAANNGFFENTANFPDGVHPDDAGHSVYANLAFGVLNPILMALRPSAYA